MVIDQDAGLAERIRTLRTREGWTLQELADRSSVSRATLSRIENAEVSPNTQVLAKLCSAFGLTLISSWLLDHRVAIQLIGGSFLLFLAWRILAMGQGERGGAAAATDNDSSVLHSFGSTFALTLTNPITILAFLGIFTAVGIAEVSHDRWLAAALVAGVFIGSMAWWLFLAAGAGYFRRHLQGGGLRWVNRISGFLMLAFGLYALVELAINLTKGP